MMDVRAGNRRRGVGVSARWAAAAAMAVAWMHAAGCSWNAVGPGPARTPADAPPLAPSLRTGRPTLLELGSVRCIPCRMMAPILDELKRMYAGKLEVVFIDVWKDRSVGRRHRIRVIPTQIFFDAAGRELYRHEGFFSRGAIVKKWKELGVALEDPPGASSK